MKNRKLAIVAFLLVAVLAIGVGYAALTDLLSVNGTLEAHSAAADIAFDEEIYFSNPVLTQGVEESSGSEYYDTVSIDDDPDIAYFTCDSLAEDTDVVIYTYTINNISEHDALVKVQTAEFTGVNPTAFNVTLNVPAEGVALDAGTTFDLVVTVSLATAAPISGSLQAGYALVLEASVN